jgi:hypothetical protein
LLSRQVALLDALGAGRTARKNARLEGPADPHAEAMTTQMLLAARTAIATLGASVKLRELTESKAGELHVQSVRQALVPLAECARAKTAAELSAQSSSTEHERALRELALPSLELDERILLSSLLDDLQRIRITLQSLHEARG